MAKDQIIHKWVFNNEKSIKSLCGMTKYFHSGEHVFNCEDSGCYDLICSECKNKYCTEDECPDFNDCIGCKDILILSTEEWTKIPSVSVCGVKEIE